MVKNFKKIKLFVIFLSFFFLASVFVTKPLFAQNTEIETIYFTPQIEIPFSSISGETAVGSPDADGFIVSDLLARYVKAIYDYGIMVGGILAAIMLMGGGLIWLTSGGDSGKVSKAKSIITGSITGVVILMGAYFILNTINPDLIEMKGVKMIVTQNINITEVICCHPQQGPITFQVKEEKGYTRYTTGDKAGEIFTSCEAELMATTCDKESGSTCNLDRNADKQYICTNPANICCTCTMGNAMMNNRYNVCKRNISEEACNDFCEKELILYNNTNNKDYKLYKLSTDSGFGRINPDTYQCEATTGVPKGEICTYK